MSEVTWQKVFHLIYVCLFFLLRMCLVCPCYVDLCRREAVALTTDWPWLFLTSGSRQVWFYFKLHVIYALLDCLCCLHCSAMLVHYRIYLVEYHPTDVFLSFYSYSFNSKKVGHIFIVLFSRYNNRANFFLHSFCKRQILLLNTAQ